MQAAFDRGARLKTEVLASHTHSRRLDDCNHLNDWRLHPLMPEKRRISKLFGSGESSRELHILRPLCRLELLLTHGFDPDFPLTSRKNKSNPLDSDQPSFVEGDFAQNHCRQGNLIVDGTLHPRIAERCTRNHAPVLFYRPFKELVTGSMVGAITAP